jgi:putative ABC transport system substrate-binding protein
MKRRVFVGLVSAGIAYPIAQSSAQAQKKLPRVGVLVSASPPHPLEDALRRGLRKLGYVEGENIAFQFRYTDGRSDRAVKHAAELVSLDVDVIVAHFTPAFDPHREVLVKLALKHRLAYLSHERATVVAGALAGFSADYLALYERAAYFVDRFLKGAKPADLPVEQPIKFGVVINRRTARELGLNLSSLLLMQADEVFE